MQTSRHLEVRTVFFRFVAVIRNTVLGTQQIQFLCAKCMNSVFIPFSLQIITVRIWGEKQKHKEIVQDATTASAITTRDNKYFRGPLLSLHINALIYFSP